MFSRRSCKTVDGTVTNYPLAGTQEIGEYDGSGNLLRRFVYGTEIDEPVVMITVATPKQYLYHYADGLGSIAATADASKTLVDQRG